MEQGSAQLCPTESQPAAIMSAGKPCRINHNYVGTSLLRSPPSHTLPGPHQRTGMLLQKEARRGGRGGGLAGNLVCTETDPLLEPHVTCRFLMISPVSV